MTCQPSKAFGWDGTLSLRRKRAYTPDKRISLRIGACELKIDNGYGRP
jgi:hypothetical protein